MTAAHSGLTGLIDFLRRSGSRLPVNMFQATGHVMAETENFLRMRYLGEIPADRPYLLIFPDNDFGRAIASLYGHLFRGVVVDNEWFAGARDIALYHPELTLDIGVSHLKINPLPGRPSRIIEGNGRLWHMVHRDDAIDLTVGLYRRRAASREYLPLWHDEPLPAALADRIGRVGKYALIHLKINSLNATARPTDPTTYLDAMGYLQDCGYRLVLAGREPMPDAFRRFDIYDYAGDSLASFRNDLILFRHARFALLGGSGISYLAEAFDIPFVYANYWHLCFPPFARRAVTVPTLLALKGGGPLLGLADHFGLLRRYPDFGFWNFPAEALDPRDATGDEILAATREALALADAIPPPSPLQRRCNSLDPQGCAGLGDSRVASYFLDRFAGLLDGPMARFPG